MTPDDLAWATVTPRKCRHPRQNRRVNSDGVVTCGACLQVIDPALARMGRLNRSRGNAIERDVAKQLGLRRVGHFGGAADAGDASEPFVVSVKSTSINPVTGKASGYFSERYWDQLKRLPVNGQQTAILVVTDAPGPGHKRRAYVVCELGDWIQLHGESGVGEAA